MALRRLLPLSDVLASPPQGGGVPGCQPNNHGGFSMSSASTILSPSSRPGGHALVRRPFHWQGRLSSAGMRLRSGSHAAGRAGWLGFHPDPLLNVSNNAHMDEARDRTRRVRPETHDCAVQVRIPRPESPSTVGGDINVNSPKRQPRRHGPPVAHVSPSRASSQQSDDHAHSGRGISFYGANVPHMYGLDYDQDEGFSEYGADGSRESLEEFPAPATGSRTSSRSQSRRAPSDDDTQCSLCEYIKWFFIFGMWQVVRRHKKIILPIMAAFVLLTSLHCLWPVVTTVYGILTKPLTGHPMPPIASMMAVPFLSSSSSSRPSQQHTDGSSQTLETAHKGCEAKTSEALAKCLEDKKLRKDNRGTQRQAEADCQVERLREEVEALRQETAREREAKVTLQGRLAELEGRCTQLESQGRVQAVELQQGQTQLLQDLALLKLAQGSMATQHQDCCRNLSRKVTDTVHHVIDQREAEKANKPLSKSAFSSSDPTDAHILAIVEEALAKYSADKTGMADYALESAGGSVVTSRTSETYDRRTWLYSAFGIPLWYTYNTARTVISPEVLPGQCWSIPGSKGQLMLQLAKPIELTGVTLEHIPKVLSPSGSISSAPRDFSVLGYHSETDMEGVLLGNFTYQEDGKPIQYFPIQGKEAGYFCYVEMAILSNHGNPEYTCLYRLRVHGQPKPDEAPAASTPSP